MPQEVRRPARSTQEDRRPERGWLGRSQIVTPTGCRYRSRVTWPQPVARRTSESRRRAGAPCWLPRRTTSRTAPLAPRIPGSRELSSSDHHRIAKPRETEDTTPQPSRASPARTTDRRGSRCPSCRRTEHGSHSTTLVRRSGTRSTDPLPSHRSERAGSPATKSAGGHQAGARRPERPRPSMVAEPHAGPRPGTSP